MGQHWASLGGSCGGVLRERAGLGVRRVVSFSGAAAVCVLVGTIPISANAQRPVSVVPLVFDGVIVVDVEHGTLVSDQRVMIAGNRIQAVGDVRTITLPRGARRVNARGKYLIPGLWDMHAHVQTNHAQGLLYPYLVANGVTGIRDLNVPSLDSALRWRGQVAAGALVGPRAVFSGPALSGVHSTPDHIIVDVDKVEWGRHLVDSLQAAGADLIAVRCVEAADRPARASDHHQSCRPHWHLGGDEWSSAGIGSSLRTHSSLAQTIA
jgi:hypothetical protein